MSLHTKYGRHRWQVAVCLSTHSPAGLEWRTMVDAKPQVLYSRENTPEPTLDEGRWARGPVQTGLEYKQYLAPPTGFKPLTAKHVQVAKTSTLSRPAQ